MVLFAAAFGIGIARIVYNATAGREARIRRRLARRAPVAVAEALEGPVRLIGRVHPTGEPLIAPISRRPCIAYQTKISLGNDDGWNKALGLEDMCPFILADETGQAVIEVEAGPYSILLVPGSSASSSLFREDSAEMKNARGLLRSENIDDQTFFGKNRPVKFSESVLLAGAEVSVAGRCTREVALDGERGGYRDLPQRLVVRGTAEEPLLLCSWREVLEKPAPVRPKSR